MPALRASRLALAGLLACWPLAAQESDVPTAIGGGALGAYSGVTLGLVGGLGTCSRMMSGTTCARVAAGIGAAVGATSGALIGYHAPDEIGNRLRGAGIGALVGTAVGLGVRTQIRQYRWVDVLSAAAVGSAVGSAPVGSGLGFGAGLVVGGILWLAAPGEGLPEAVATALAGLAIGGLTDWALGAARSGDPPAGGDGAASMISVSIRL